MTQSKTAVPDQITALLRTDPQAAMVMMVEEYTGLIWKVIERYLKDPEDIKECINDTFFQFYTHQERFDPQKGTMQAFLAAIARNVAISRYRKNRIRSAGALTEEIPADTDEILNMDEKIDLENALKVLKPEDAEIIRMRYYGGMSVQEIADSLNLPYETVKKRHQRSLGKMRLILIAGLILILGLLAACIYAVVKEFWILPGFGVMDVSGASVCRLEEPVCVEDEYGIYTVERGYLIDDKVLLQGTVHFKSEDSNAWILPKDPESSILFARITYGETMYPSPLNWNTYDTRDREFECGTSQMALLEEEEEARKLTLNLGELEFSLVFCPTEPRGLEDYSYKMGDKGGMMAFPYWAEDHLLVDLYPLNAEGYQISNRMITSIYSMEENGTDVITLSNEDEAVCGQLDGARWTQMAGFMDLTTWDFGPVEPGSYTLHIPYLFLEQSVENPAVIPLNLEECSWKEQEYSVPGGVVVVTDCQRLETVAQEPILDSGEFAREGMSYWTVTMDFREDPKAGVDYRVMPSGLRLSFPGHPLELDGEYGCRTMKEGQVYQLLFWIEDGIYDLSQAQLQAEDVMVLQWNCNFDIPVTVPDKM